MNAEIESPASAELLAQARLLQLASPALPTGSYAYSGGLEAMLSLEILKTEDEWADCLCSLMMSSVAQLDIPLYVRMYDACGAGQDEVLQRLSLQVLASRETRELQDQEQQMGRALGRVLMAVHDRASERPPFSYLEALARASVVFKISRKSAALLLAYTWAEQHVSALSRLLPLGPLASQDMLNSVLQVVPQVVVRGLNVKDEEVGASAPNLAWASSLHENQYCRIFRS